jgi:hypothetical protein
MPRSPPKAPDTWKPLVGDPAPGTNDWVDIAHLAAVYHDAVDYLVTEDLRLRRKSRKVDLGERVVSVDEAQCVLLRAGFYSCGRLAPPLPSTPACLAHKDPAW